MSAAQVRHREAAQHEAARLREVTRQLLAECRRELREALAAAEPDPTAVLELRLEEHLLQDRLGESTPAGAAAWPGLPG